MVDFELFRNEDGTIDLVSAWKYLHWPEGGVVPTVVSQFFDDINFIFPIKSRQAASIALAQSNFLKR